MKVSQLFAIFPQFRLGEFPLQDVKLLTADSRQVEVGAVFVAVRGGQSDGHKFLTEVCGRGAAAVVVEDTTGIPADFKGAVVRVGDSRQALHILANRLFGEPSRRLFCAGVTGTNGKTSTTYMIEAILQEFGWPTGVLGTIDHHMGDVKWDTSLTTPDAVTLHRRLHEMETLGAKAVAFEVSSHALHQMRVDSIPFDAIVFTNLTRDHLDYHKTMAEYFAAKERLFYELPAQAHGKRVKAIINGDDAWGRKLRVSELASTWFYGEGQCDFQFQIMGQNFSGSRFNLRTNRGDIEMGLALPGRHNVYNAVAAVAVGVWAGASLETCAKALQVFAGVPGRLQKVENNRGLHVFVDYAHTDDALRTVLTTLRQTREQAMLKNKIITVFGCGGDRDKGKRPLMAQAAIEKSDFVIVTSDNPRTEDPKQIITDILTGVPRDLLDQKVFVEVDRKLGLNRALSLANEGDVVLVAGKGHENYQIIGQQKIEFSDAKVVKEILEKI